MHRNKKKKKKKKWTRLNKNLQCHSPTDVRKQWDQFGWTAYRFLMLLYIFAKYFLQGIPKLSFFSIKLRKMTSNLNSFSS